MAIQKTYEEQYEVEEISSVKLVLKADDKESAMKIARQFFNNHNMLDKNKVYICRKVKE